MNDIQFGDCRDIMRGWAAPIPGLFSSVLSGAGNEPDEKGEK